jgi:hypothetical protein
MIRKRKISFLLNKQKSFHLNRSDGTRKLTKFILKIVIYLQEIHEDIYSRKSAIVYHICIFVLTYQTKLFVEDIKYIISYIFLSVRPCSSIFFIVFFTP